MLNIQLLGSLRLTQDETVLKFSAPPKATPLWAYLLLHRHQPVQRTTLAYTLWPDDSEAEARKNLRRHVYQLQKALPQVETPWLLTEHDTLQWNPAAACKLDLVEFERLASNESSWAEAIALYTGDLLETLYDDWLFYERERLRDLYFATLTNLISQAHSRRQYANASAYAQQLLGRDPLREDTLRQLMIVRHDSGDRAGALKEYERFARRLREELGVDPMPETIGVYESIVRNTTQPSSPIEIDEASSTTRKTLGTSLPLVGRDTELGQLQAWWSRAARGRGSVALLGGEAGAGKSRLASELKAQVESANARTLIGGTTFAEPTPYQSVVEALHSALPLIAALELEPSWMATLTTLVPDLQAYRPPGARPLPLLPPLDSDRERGRLFEAIGRCLTELARLRPLLIILEDLHWAGSATMNLIESLARLIVGQSILILITYREEEAPRTHPLRDLRRRLQREQLVSHLTLNRLSPQAVTDLVTQVPGASTALAEQLFNESEGNPFFLTELIRDWTETGAMQPDQLLAAKREAPPRGVQAIITGRLNRLSAQSQALAEIAAVIGPAFDVELVREAGGWNENQVLEALNELLDHQLIRETGGRSRSDYTFTHHLIQAAIYGETPPAVRVRRHQRVAQIIEDLYPHRLESLASVLAHHWQHAGDPATAADYFVRAARRSLAVYAADEALAYLQQALALNIGPRLRFEATALSETIHHRRGLRAEQQTDLAQMEQLAKELAEEDLICETLRRQIIYHRTIGERQAEAALIAALTARAELSGDARWQAEALQAEAAELIIAGQFDSARSATERALALRESINDISGQVTCFCQLIETAARQGRFRLIPPLLEKSKALAESLSDLGLQAQTLRMACLAAHEKQETDSRAVLGKELLSLYQTIGDREGEAYTYAYLATAAVDLFKVQEARDYFAKAEGLYEALGVKLGQAGVLINSGVLLIRLGRIAEGIERCRKAEKLFEVLKEVRGQIICALNISAAAFSMGNYELAKSAARRNLELAQAIANEEFIAFAYANLGRAERELGELESAIAHMRAGLELRRVIADPVQMVTNWSDLVIAYLRLGDVESARRDTEAMLALIAACADQLREPQRPLWAAAQTFHQLGDSSRATNFLTQAHAALLAKAAEVPDSESRATFLAIPYNHEILAAFEGNEWPSNPRHRP